MIINFIYEPSVDSAPSGFETALNVAAQYLDNLITNPISVNIQVGYGDLNGNPNPVSGNLGVASAMVRGFSYAQLHTTLIAHATSADDLQSLGSLPAVDLTSGGTFFSAAAQLKAWGLIAANATAIDGFVGFSNTAAFDYDTSDGISSGKYDFTGVALHELSHALGRGIGTTFSTLDLFRFSAPGVHQVTPGAAGYFSIDNGNTALENFAPGALDGDWLPSGPPDANQGIPPGIQEAFSSADIREMDVLGFTVQANPHINQVFRFFDSATGDHFYTLSTAEANQIRATLPTYHDEGTPWSTPDAGTGAIDVYRFFDVATNTHFLTSSLAERNQVIATLPSYHYEGVAFEAYQTTGTDRLTLERFFNTQSHLHHYAASPAETASILSGGAGPGWVDEGAGFIVHT